MHISFSEMWKLLGTFLMFLLLVGCEPEPNKDANRHIFVSEVKNDANEHSAPKKLKQVILTLGSWRIEDVAQINDILSKFTNKYPQIVIKFDPTNPADYNDVLEAQLQNGTAPDIFYLRSFSQSKKLFKQGDLVTLNNLPNIRDNYSPQTLSAWASDDGDIYGVPLMSVSHGIYFNSTLFQKMGLGIPQSWQELLSLSKKIKDSGITPFANATGALWTTNALILQNLIPGFIGGEKARLEYYSGKRCFNDKDMVSVFKAIQDLSAYLPQNQKLLKYGDSLQLFLQGKAAMFFGGSWDIPFFIEQSPDFDWRVFAIPPPQGKEFYVTVHPDAAIGLNSASPYIDEAKLFLEWMTTQEFAQLFADKLPGFFPMHNNIAPVKNRFADMFLSFNKKYKTDIRIWGKIPKYGEPSAYSITRQASVDVINGDITPKQAADLLQDGLSQWYIPAQKCQHE